ncbi:MAG: hypothetical protein IKA62_08020 [Clostridia bacterium]|nr:hypothetical protein [Clostridia bacterium]
MLKKIIICIILLAVLLLFIFAYEAILNPSGFFGSLGCAFIIEKCGMFWGHVLSYLLVCTGFLFWVGVSAAWKWARNNDFGLVMSVFCAFLGIYLSFPIAIVQLFLPST